jgi:hypothetical protein
MANNPMAADEMDNINPKKSSVNPSSRIYKLKMTP